MPKKCLLYLLYKVINRNDSNKTTKDWSEKKNMIASTRESMKEDKNMTTTVF